MQANYLHSVKKEFHYYKTLAEKAIQQVPEEKFSWQFNNESNSLALIIKHMNGNMLSRWTDLLTSDGEKEWRDRDQEFTPAAENKSVLMQQWEIAWNHLFTAVDALTPSDLESIIYIRNQGHTVVEAINRQLAHYPYHVGQIVFLAKMICSKDWISLSIPKNESASFNKKHFSQEKKRKHFTDDLHGSGRQNNNDIT